MVYYSVSGYNSVMFLADILYWWYGSGWLGQLKKIMDRLTAAIDFFSIGLLITTLFSPFRQISAEKIDGPIGDKLRAFVDKLISRVVGATVRTLLIVIGIAVIIIQFAFGIVFLITWLFIPAFPVIGLIMAVIGWVP